MQRLLVRIGAPIVVLVVFVTCWWVASANSTSVFFPPLHDILIAFKDNWFSSNLVDKAVPSLVRVTIGLVLAVIGGVTIGALLGLLPKVDVFVRPELEFMRALPPILIFPPLLLVMGTGDSMKVAVIAVSAVWPILLATTDGVKAVEPLRYDMGRAFGLPWSARVRWIILPTAIPHIWSAVRAAVPIAIVVMVASEYFASTNGLGAFISETSVSFRMADMWSVVLLLGFFGMLINGVVAAIGTGLDRQFGEFGDLASGRG